MSTFRGPFLVSRLSFAYFPPCRGRRSRPIAPTISLTNTRTLLVYFNPLHGILNLISCSVFFLFLFSTAIPLPCLSCYLPVDFKLVVSLLYNLVPNDPITEYLFPSFLLPCASRGWAGDGAVSDRVRFNSIFFAECARRTGVLNGRPNRQPVTSQSLECFHCRFCKPVAFLTNPKLYSSDIPLL